MADVNRMAGLALAAALLFLAGCASQSPILAPDCLATGDARLSGRFALVVDTASGSDRLLIASQWQGGQLQVVGFNAIGAKLFHGHMTEGRVAAETSPLYRGAAVEPLVWGLLVHQLGNHLSVCWPQGQVRMEGGRFVLRQGGQVVYRSSAPDSFALPPEDVDVQIKRLDDR